jgi:UTP-glucose-1-phosphate uridylyltransferase
MEAWMLNIAEPVLVVMAAGMGSRFGGLKQMEPIDGAGHILLDYAVYDALRAGFRQVLFIIRRDFGADFRASVGQRIERMADVTYAYQELDMLPAGRSVPLGRQKPWGTTHAVWCCMDALHGASFLTVNADDYYGAEAYQIAFRFLSGRDDPDVHSLIGMN